jgi:hypothetical protein
MHPRCVVDAPWVYLECVCGALVMLSKRIVNAQREHREWSLGAWVMSRRSIVDALWGIRCELVKRDEGEEDLGSFESGNVLGRGGFFLGGLGLLEELEHPRKEL